MINSDDWMVNPFWLGLDDSERLRLRGHEDLELRDEDMRPLQVATVLRAQQERNWIVFRCHPLAEGVLFLDSSRPSAPSEAALFRSPRPCRSLIGDLIGFAASKDGTQPVGT